MVNLDSKKAGNIVNLPLWFLGALLFVTLLKLGLHTWILDKGIDIWDESWYITILNYFKQYPTEPHSYYGYVLNKLLPISYNIISLRVLGLLSELIGAVYFSWCFVTWLQQQHLQVRFKVPFSLVLLLVLIAGTFTSVYTRAFSYNDMSYLLMLVTTGTTFAVLKHRQPPSARSKVIAVTAFLLIGLMLGLLLIVKFSTSILTAGWIAIFTIVHIQRNWKLKTLLITAMIIGIASFIGLFFKDTEHIALWIQNMQHGISMLRLLSYDTYGIFVQGYIKVDIIENGIYYAIPLLISALAYQLLRKKNSESVNNTSNLLITYLLGIAAWLVTSLTIKHAFLGEFFNRFIALHIYTLLFWCIPFIKQQLKNKQWRTLFYLLLMMVLPYIALMGSNNPTTETLTKYLVPWYLIIVLLLSYQTAHSKHIFRSFIVVIVLYASFNYVSVQLLNPYGMRLSVFQQTEPVSGLKYIDGLKFDKASAQFFKEIKTVTEKSGYTEGGPILALGDLCGPVVAMGGYIPETFWFFSDGNATSPQHARAFNCYHLGELRIAEHPRLPLVMINSGMHADVIDCLEESEVPFPEAYYLVNKINNPYAQETLSIWAPKNWQLPY